jgi:hypothetical protein
MVAYARQSFGTSSRAGYGALKFGFATEANTGNHSRGTAASAKGDPRDYARKFFANSTNIRIPTPSAASVKS